MPSWDDPSANIVADNPARASDVLKIQENIEAVAAGVSGAPRVAVDLDGLTALGTDAGNPAGQTIETDGAGSFVLAGVRQHYQRDQMTTSGGGTPVLGDDSAGTEVANVGTPAITFSAGVFTLPVTGLYLIQGRIVLLDAGTDFVRLQKDTGSGWTTIGDDFGDFAVGDQRPSAVHYLQAGDKIRVIADASVGSLQITRL